MPLIRTTSPARRRVGLLPAFALSSLLVGSAPFAHAQSVVSASPDVTTPLGAAHLATPDDAVAVDNQLGIVALANLGPIPESADVIGYGELLGGAKLMTFDTTVALSGGVVARPGDVVAWNGSVHSLVFDATAAGIPSGIEADAVSLAASSGLLLSFDTDVALPGALTVADEDLVRWNGSSFSLAFDGSAAGVDRALDVDAAQDLGGGAFLMSFDTAGSVGGIVFQDEDVLRYAGGAWSLEIDGSALDADWGAADLVAVQVPEPDGVAGVFVGTLACTGLAARRRARGRRRVAG